MKYIIYFIAAVIICGGCKQLPDDNGNQLQYGVQIVVVKGCEFVVAYVEKGVSIVHHPDCHNRFHGVQFHLNNFDTIKGNEITIDGNDNRIDMLYLDSNGVVVDHQLK